ncbi:MAG: hypothetical protein WCA35_09335 [Kovacikia sp.]
MERAEAIAAIRQGLAEFERDEGQPAREALEALRAKHGIQRVEEAELDEMWSFVKSRQPQRWLWPALKTDRFYLLREFPIDLKGGTSHV